jgi:hypothetical protein
MAWAPILAFAILFIGLLLVVLEADAHSRRRK